MPVTVDDQTTDLAQQVVEFQEINGFISRQINTWLNVNPGWRVAQLVPVDHCFDPDNGSTLIVYCVMERMRA